MARKHPALMGLPRKFLRCLEDTLNYRRRGWVPASVLGRAVIPDEVAIDVVTLADLPRNWSAPEPPSKLRDIGQHWLERGPSAILKVPSAVVVEEWNSGERTKKLTCKINCASALESATAGAV